MQAAAASIKQRWTVHNALLHQTNQPPRGRPHTPPPLAPNPQAGAPAAAWLVLRCPPQSDALLAYAVWQSKTRPPASLRRSGGGCSRVGSWALLPLPWVLPSVLHL
jgi:hypothetical protein